MNEPIANLYAAPDSPSPQGILRGMTRHLPGTREANWGWGARWGTILAILGSITACGGGDGKGGDVLRSPEPDAIAGPACAQCKPGQVNGMASTGEPIANAHVRVFDTTGRNASGRTDADGRFIVDVQALQGPLVLQVAGVAGGQAVMLHTLATAPEAAQRLLPITPLTELIAARVLGGMPADMIVHGRVDALRISAPALAQAQMQIHALVRPLLSWAEAEDSDLRLSPLSHLPAGDTGLNKLVRALVLTPAGQGHQLRALWQAPQAAIQIGTGGGEVGNLAAPTATQQQAMSEGQQALREIESQLAMLSDLFAQGMPPAPSLQAWLHDDFRHAGLDRSAYIDRVLLRQDPEGHGGFSFVGARFSQARLLQAADARRLRVRFHIQPRAPFEPFEETLWMAREGGIWRWQGDGGPAKLRVRHAFVLSAQGMDEAAVRALPGVRCGPPDGRCLAEGGQPGVAGGGFMDWGLPLSEVSAHAAPVSDHFGLLALYRSDAPTAEERLHAHATHSRFLGEASAAIQPYLLFELDARQSDPRATHAVLRGPGLPSGGLPLRRPATTAGRPDFDHWAWPTSDSELFASEDWCGIPVHWCDTPDSASCEQAWTTVGTGSRYTVSLYDAQGQLLGQVEAALPPPPLALRHQAATRDSLAPFALWRLPPERHVTLSWLLGASSPSGDALEFDVPWQAPASPWHTVAGADLSWHRAGFPPTFGQDVHRQRIPLAGNAGSHVLQLSAPARPGFRTIWLSLRLGSRDLHGNRFIHALSPSNPW